MKNINKIIKPIMRFIIKHNLVIFTVFIISGLIVSVYYLNDSLTTPSKPHSTDANTQINSFNFTNYQTINNYVLNLKTNAQMPEVIIPSVRYNPFAE